MIDGKYLNELANVTWESATAARTWYHISFDWTATKLLVKPRINRSDSKDTRDTKPSINVTPSPLQCLIAVGAWYDYFKLSLYKTTTSVVKPIPATWVFDYKYTQEHRFYEPLEFVFCHDIDQDKLFDMKIDKFKLDGLSENKLIKNIEKVLFLLKDKTL